MGMFSWKTQDTYDAIRNNVAINDKRARAYMHDNKGNIWEELNYEGYGVFGNKDYFQLLAEMNNLEGLTGDVDKDRNLGINLNYSDKPFISPNLTRNKEWVWINKVPEDDPNQGWGGDESEDD
jgi:hypothetical protein